MHLPRLTGMRRQLPVSALLPCAEKRSYGRRFEKKILAATVRYSLGAPEIDIALTRSSRADVALSSKLKSDVD